MRPQPTNDVMTVYPITHVWLCEAHKLTTLVALSLYVVFTDILLVDKFTILFFLLQTITPVVNSILCKYGTRVLLSWHIPSDDIIRDRARFTASRYDYPVRFHNPLCLSHTPNSHGVHFLSRRSGWSPLQHSTGHTPRRPSSWLCCKLNCCQ